MSDALDAYANAMFDVAQSEGRLDTVEDELFRLGQTLENSDSLRNALTDENIPAGKRQAIVEDLFGGKVSSTTTQLVSFVVGSGRSRDLSQIISRLGDRVAATKQKAVAEVRTAVPLSDDQTHRLATALAHATGKSVVVKNIIDPSILGGLVAQVGDQIIDGSVRTRLDQLKAKL